MINDPMDYLMYKSGLTAQGCWDQMDSYDQEAVEKFARLLILECAEIAGCNGHVSGFELADMIRRHFGVPNE